MSIASPSRTVSLGPGASLINSRPFLQLCAWGAGAALALIVAVAAARTDLGAERARAAMTAMLSPPQSPDRQLSAQIATLSGEFDQQMRRHAEAIRALAEQRDSLSDKVGTLERQINELGGTLARTAARLEGETRSAQQAAAAASAVAASTRLAQPKPEPAESSSSAAVAAFTPPATSANTSSYARTPPSAPQGAAPLPPGQIHPAATSATGFPTASGAAPPAQAYTGAISAPAVPDANGPPGMMRPFPVQPPTATTADHGAVSARPNGAKALPPAATAPPMFRSNPLMTAGIFETPTQPVTAAAEFAIDLGAAPTVDALRARWTDLRNSQSPLLDNLKPMVTLKDGAKSGQELHLVAGPLNNNAAALRLCAVLVGTSALCQPTMYEGQRLTAR